MSRDRGIYGLLREPSWPDHAFDGEGRCVYCGTTAEEWEAPCTEDDLQATLD